MGDDEPAAGAPPSAEVTDEAYAVRGAADFTVRQLTGGPVADLPPAPLGDHLEALAAVRFLRTGVCLMLLRTALLVAAVGVTWYAPGS